MELDVKMFLDSVKELKDTQSEEREAGLKYLYDVVFATLMKKGEIYLSDIDFSRFTDDEYNEFYHDAEAKTNNAERLYSLFDKAAPCGMSENRMFF